MKESWFYRIKEAMAELIIVIIMLLLVGPDWQDWLLHKDDYD